MAGKYAIETVFSLIDKFTRPLSNINNESKIVNRTLKNMFTGAEKASDKFLSKLKGFGGKLTSALGLAGIINIDKVVGFLTKDIKNAMDFTDSMAKTASLVDTTIYSMSALEKELKNVAKESGFAVTELAKIQFDAIGLGVNAGASAEFAASIAKTVKVIGVSNETALNSMTTILSAYGKGAGEVDKIASQMYLATTVGRASFDEMNSSLKRVIPTAAALNVDTGDLFAGISTLTGMGEKTTDAMKLMGDAMDKVITPSKQAAEMARALGLDFSETALRSKGLAGFIEELGEKTGGNTKILETLFGNVDIARIMSKLSDTGAEAFRDAVNRMADPNVITAAFDRITDTPAERWRKAMNKLNTVSIDLGQAFIPVIERVITKVTEIIDRIKDMDFSGLETTIGQVLSAVEGFVNVLMGAIQIAWQFRGIIAAVAIVMGIYYGLSMLVVGAAKLFTAWEGIKTAAVFAFTLATQGQMVAMELLNKKSLAYLVVDKIFTAATAIRSAVLGVLTGGTLAQSAATASMAVATGTATAAQWLLNAAMNANPVGLVVLAVAALVGIIAALVKWGKMAAGVIITIGTVIGVIVAGPIGLLVGAIGLLISGIMEVVRGWGTVTKAFESGGILGALKQIGALLLSGILAPIQGLLETLTKIPGVEKLLGPAVNAIKNFRQNLTGIDETATVHTKIEEPPTSNLDADMAALMGQYQVAMPGIDMPDIAMPDISTPIDGGKSKIHGVVDIAEGAASIPSIGGEPITKTAANGATAAASGAPSTALIAATVTGIAALIRNIDGNITAIVSRYTQTAIVATTIPIGNASASIAPEGFAEAVNIPGVPDTETVSAAISSITAILKNIDNGVLLIVSRTAAVISTAASPRMAGNVPRFASPPLPRLYTGNDENDAAAASGARNIAPITQGERMAYRLEERRETVAIEVSAARGSEARIIRAPRDMDIELTSSGGIS
jgi:TP901 family phage tail tape measure protein